MEMFLTDFLFPKKMSVNVSFNKFPDLLGSLQSALIWETKQNRQYDLLTTQNAGCSGCRWKHCHWNNCWTESFVTNKISLWKKLIPRTEEDVHISGGCSVLDKLSTPMAMWISPRRGLLFYVWITFFPFFASVFSCQCNSIRGWVCPSVLLSVRPS